MSYLAVNYEAAAGTAVNSTSTNTWHVRTLTGAPVSSIVDVAVENLTGATVSCGVRAVGSSLTNRYFGLLNSNTTVMRVETDASGQIEIYSSNNTNLNFKYWGKPK